MATVMAYGVRRMLYGDKCRACGSLVRSFLVGIEIEGEGYPVAILLLSEGNSYVPLSSSALDPHYKLG